MDGFGCNVIQDHGVRPALNLDLTKVVFSPDTKAFLFPQTITAADMTVTYGETNKKVTATTTGNGRISYAVIVRDTGSPLSAEPTEISCIARSSVGNAAGSSSAGTGKATHPSSGNARTPIRRMEF